MDGNPIADIVIISDYIFLDTGLQYSQMFQFIEMKVVQIQRRVGIFFTVP